MALPNHQIKESIGNTKSRDELSENSRDIREIMEMYRFIYFLFFLHKMIETTKKMVKKRCRSNSL